jgi:hypothetical protein
LIDRRLSLLPIFVGLGRLLLESPPCAAAARAVLGIAEKLVAAG